MRWRTASCLLLGLGAVAGIHACKTPTQVELDVTTRAACTDMKGVDIIVAGDRETAESRAAASFPTTTASDCVPVGGTNRIGTLVITPGPGETASVIVVAGFLERASTCKPPLYKGCIVARRFFSFVSSVSSRLPIVLEPDCVDVPCDANSTCFGKRCVDSRVDCTVDDTCGSAVLPPDAGTPGPDGATPDGAVDGPIADADASTDAPVDADAADAKGDGTTSTLMGNCPYSMSCPGTLGCTSNPAAEQACCWNAGIPSANCGKFEDCAGFAQCCQGSSDCNFYPGRDRCCSADNPPKPNSRVMCNSENECDIAKATYLCKIPSGGAASADCPSTHPVCTNVLFGGPWTGTYVCGDL